MTRHSNDYTDSENGSGKPRRATTSAQEVIDARVLFEGTTPFEAEMIRVAILDQHEDGSCCGSSIAATAKLAPDVRRDLLLEASAALLGHCDRHGAAECLKQALGLV